MSYVAFIPARSGSKRILNKNIRFLGDKPLVIWTIDACLKCEKISKVILSTDSDQYIKIVQKYITDEKLEFDFRKTTDANDNTKIYDYLSRKHKKIFKNSDENNFILALPTAPFRTEAHLNEAIEMFEKKKKAVFSATEYDFPTSFAFTLDDNNNWTPLFENSPMLNGNTRSQDNISAYRPNGAIYIRKISDLTEPKFNTLYIDAIPYLMKREHSIDIDSEVDFQLAESIINISRIE